MLFLSKLCIKKSLIHGYITSLVQDRHTGLSTLENKKQLMIDQRKKAHEFRRLQLKQCASNKCRNKQKKFFFSF
jgi:hypothetical protein